MIATRLPDGPHLHAPAVAHVTTSMSRHGGGVTVVMQSLLQRLRDRGVVRVAAIGVEDGMTEADRQRWGGVAIEAVPAYGPGSLSFCPRMQEAIASQRPDMVHLHGVWSWPTAVCGRLQRRSGTPVLVSPHGMLDPWILAHGRWKKTLANFVYQRRALRGAGCLHALCAAEADAIRSQRLGNPICIIANGVEEPDPRLSQDPPPWNRAAADARRCLLFLGRLHPKKGLAELIQGMALALRDDPTLRDSWRLIIVGGGQEDYERSLREMVHGLGLDGTISLLGPLHGREKTAALANADAFILPSYSEGVPMAVLEAWSHGLAVLMTAQCNLPEGFATSAAVRIDCDSATLARQLREIMLGSDHELRAMGERGRRLVRARFSWATIASEFEQVYRWMLGGGPSPGCVIAA